jgi:cystathionine beta-lyase/cystathionine gamma-synthase
VVDIRAIADAARAAALSVVDNTFLAHLRQPLALGPTWSCIHTPSPEWSQRRRRRAVIAATAGCRRIWRGGPTPSVTGAPFDDFMTLRCFRCMRSACMRKSAVVVDFLAASRRFNGVLPGLADHPGMRSAAPAERFSAMLSFACGRRACGRGRFSPGCNAALAESLGGVKT